MLCMRMRDGCTHVYARVVLYKRLNSLGLKLYMNASGLVS